MKKTIILLSLITAFASGAAAGSAETEKLIKSDAQLRAMTEELQRSSGMHNGAMPGPYFITYITESSTQTVINASFGGVTYYQPEKQKSSAEVEVRVGSPAFDSSLFADGDTYEPFGSYYNLPAGGKALRSVLWQMTDEAYKQAVDLYEKKQVFVKQKKINELYADLTEEKPVRGYMTVSYGSSDPAVWREKIRKLSEIFTGYPSVTESKVSLLRETGESRTVNSRGTALLKKECSGVIGMSAEVYSKENYKISVYDNIFFCEEKDLPSYEKLVAAVKDFAEHADALSKAKTLKKSYIGPVLFEDGGAAFLFKKLIADGMTSPREVWNSDGTLYTQDQLFQRIGLRVLPPFLDAYDDPGASSGADAAYLAGRYVYDFDGIPASRVTLTERGKLRDYYRGSAATKEFASSNGHRRSEGGTGAGNLFITSDAGSDSVLPGKELRGRFLNLIKSEGLDYGILIKRPFYNYSPDAAVYKLYTDGREELVLNADFADLSLRTLRDIIYASKESGSYNFYSDGSPVSVTAPDVIVEEMEFKKSTDKPDRTPATGRPGVWVKK